MEEALASARQRASEAGAWEVVAKLADELAARRNATSAKHEAPASKVVPIAAPKPRRRES